MPEPAEVVRLVPEPSDVQAARIIAGAIDRAVDRFGPAADAVAHLSDAQKRLCSFVVKHRLKLAFFIPSALTLVGAISPNAAKGLHDLILAFASHP